MDLDGVLLVVKLFLLIKNAESSKQFPALYPFCDKEMEKNCVWDMIRMGGGGGTAGGGGEDFSKSIYEKKIGINQFKVTLCKNFYTRQRNIIFNEI